ncbi:hypothetical protein Tco_0842065, partial [Tanacetum coccineum]
MASMNTRLNIEKLDENIVQKHGGSKQVGLKQLGSKQVGFKQLGQKQVGFKQPGLGVETGFHGVQDEKRVWFKVELQGSSTQQCMKSRVAKHLGVAVIQQQNGLVKETNVTLLAKALQVFNFEVEPQEDHTFEVEPHANVDHVAGPQEVQTQDLIYYPIACDREQHSTRELFIYREDSNEADFADAEAEKIYAHESLKFNNTVVYVAEIWATKGLLDKAKGNVLGIDSIRDQSGNTLRVSQSRFYNEKLVWTFLEGHFILSLEGSLSGDCDVEKNGKWSCIYAVGIQEYQMVCIRLDIASADVATKEAIRLKGLAIKSGFKLKIVAGIAIGALSKAIPGP